MTVQNDQHVEQANILLIEDSPVQAELIRRVLAESGYLVSIASNGFEALGRIEAEHFDLVLLDLTLPGMDGMQVLTSIRNNYSLRELPIIIVTGKADSEEVVNSLNLGANDFVTKPLDEPVFLARIQSHLRIAAPGRDAKQASRKNFDTVASTREMSATRLINDPDKWVGQVLANKYRLEALIGKGGFGVVYRATHLGMNRNVAIKLLSVSSGASDEKLRQFQREAEAACRIDHPNAVMVFDVDVTPGAVPFIVMELLQGHPLDQKLHESGVMAAGRCAAILLPICDVLQQAHNAGVIHRDIKPSNIFLHQGPRGEVVKLLDFGTAQFDAMMGTGVRTARNTGDIIRATPEYMAPERLRDEPYDGKVDVYALGIVLYELLTGNVPFEAKDDDFMAVAYKQANETPRSVREINPEISARLEAVIVQALAKKPHERWDAKTFGQQLADATSVELDAEKFPNLSEPD